MARTLGKTIGRKIKDTSEYEDSQVQGEYLYRNRLYRFRVTLNVEYSVSTRANDYTFVVGDSAKSKIDNCMGKTSWTEEVSA